MPRYAVGHGYASNHNGRTFGPWLAGDEVELDAADAEWVNRDSPGALAPVVEKPAPKAAEREAVPAKDRQRGRTRGA